MIQIFLVDGTDGTDERTDQPKVVQEVLADLKKRIFEEEKKFLYIEHGQWSLVFTLTSADGEKTI